MNWLNWAKKNWDDKEFQSWVQGTYAKRLNDDRTDFGKTNRDYIKQPLTWDEFYNLHTDSKRGFGHATDFMYGKAKSLPPDLNTGTPQKNIIPQTPPQTPPQGPPGMTYDNNDYNKPTWMRNLFYQEYPTVDYSNANKMAEEAHRAGGYDRIAPERVGNMLAYRANDMNYNLNRLEAQNNATMSGLRASNIGNPASTQASMLAANRNFAMNRGEAMRSDMDQNFKRMAEVEDFNRATNQFNSQAALQADQANQNARAEADSRRMQGIMQSLGMRDERDASYAAAKSNYWQNINDRFQKIGEQNYAENQMNMLMGSGYFGTLSVKPQGWSDERWAIYQKQQRDIDARNQYMQQLTAAEKAALEKK